ncbi:MAG TPA: hypothetical protein VMV46_19770 [Thermoanaerobaculia bacterium]|nr:hypothetical protein [Thermoanaerobaculia bacterium]
MLINIVFALLPLSVADLENAPRAHGPAPSEASATRPSLRGAEDQVQEMTATVVEIRGRLLRGPKEAGTGTLSVSDGQVRWDNERRAKRSFSIQARVIREATLVCAERAGSDVCLELELRTVTGEKHRFRDVRWAAGDNDEIMRVYELLQERHPRIVFGERRVNRIP